jgi:hypothetical protein
MEGGSADMAPGSSDGSCVIGPPVPPGMVTVMVPMPLVFPSEWTLPHEFASNVLGGQVGVVLPTRDLTLGGVRGEGTYMRVCGRALARAGAHTHTHTHTWTQREGEREREREMERGAGKGGSVRKRDG